MSFRQYVDHGWKLCPIKAGQKAPRGKQWNHAKAALTPDRAEQTPAAGLMHAYSGTCALDLDNLELARPWLAARGIDLDALMAEPNVVAISSGRPNSWKLLYTLPEPLLTKKIVSPEKVTILELRCADNSGCSVQDLLPPSPHPSGTTYEWRYGDDLTGTWQCLPPVPPALHALWFELIGPAVPAQPTAGGLPVQSESHADVAPERIAKAHDIRERLDPDCDYGTWSGFGMALEHELGDAGWDVWQQWSVKGKKYPGEQQLRMHWDSFGRNKAVVPITFGSFLRDMVSTADDFEVVDTAAEDAVFDAHREERFAAFKRTRLHTGSDIKRQPWPRWFIRKILPVAELLTFFGPSGIGKSAIALAMALALHLGVPFLGIPTVRRRVLWIAAEAFGSMKVRIAAYAKAHDLDSGALDDFLVLESCNLNNADEVALIKQLVAEQRFEVLFIDTMAAASPGTDENSVKDTGLVREACKAIVTQPDLPEPLRAACVLIHHTGYDETHARGSTSNKAAMDAQLFAYNDAALDSKVFSTEKMRDGSDELAWRYSLNVLTVGTDEDGEPVTSIAVDFGGQVEKNAPGKKSKRKADDPETTESLARARATLDAALDGLARRGITATRRAVRICAEVKSAGYKDAQKWDSALLDLVDQGDVVAADRKAGNKVQSITFTAAGEARRADRAAAREAQATDPDFELEPEGQEGQAGE